MKKVFLIFIALAACATARGAERDLLTPEPHRITDEAISADMMVIQGLQERLAALNGKGVPIASYHFAKAQAWLDFARDEYTINDRSRVVEEALRQALILIEQLEAGNKEIGMETPVIPTSSRVRSDLWAKAAALKKDVNFACAGDTVAQLEVQLVWAGHEERELGWRHARPYIQAAERLAREADEQVAACSQSPAAASARTTAPAATAASAAVMAARDERFPCPPCAETLPATIIKALGPLPDRIHFAFDRAEISPLSAAVLDRITTAMKTDPTLRVVLYGHADQRGNMYYNMKLSRQRAENVRAFLTSAGITADRISVAPLGKNMPISEGQSPTAYARNRRVEFFFTIGPAQTVVPQQDDLQPEKVKPWI